MIIDFDSVNYISEVELRVAKYYIGVDTNDINTYLLYRVQNGVSEVLLNKMIKNDSDFNAEVNNLSKYFNATIIKEINK